MNYSKQQSYHCLSIPLSTFVLHNPTFQKLASKEKTENLLRNTSRASSSNYTLEDNPEYLSWNQLPRRFQTKKAAFRYVLKRILQNLIAKTVKFENSIWWNAKKHFRPSVSHWLMKRLQLNIFFNVFQNPWFLSKQGLCHTTAQLKEKGTKMCASNSCRARLRPDAD